MVGSRLRAPCVVLFLGASVWVGLGCTGARDSAHGSHTSDSGPGSAPADAATPGREGSSPDTDAGASQPESGASEASAPETSAPAVDAGGAVDSSVSPDAPAAEDAAPAVCPMGPPSATAAPSTVDVSCFSSTFDDEFLVYDVSSGPVADGMFPNERWFNGTEQCCMSPSGGQAGVNYPTPGPNGPVNPYSLIPGGGLQIQASLAGNTWFSGVMTSVDQNGNGFSQQYGYFEYSVKLAPGAGTWPGLWMLPLPLHVAGGEIDILEQYGLNPPVNPVAYTELHITLNDWTNAQPGTSTLAMGLPDLTAAYHRVGLLWNDTYMAFYLDDALLWSTPTLDVMKQPYYLLADMGLGSGWDTSQTPNPSNLAIQYIRAYTVPGF
jgi:Glycosyl hydrolases family 16